MMETERRLLESISAEMGKVSSRLGIIEEKVSSLQEIQELKLENAINIHNEIRKAHEIQFSEIRKCLDGISSTNTNQQHDIDYAKGGIKFLGIITIILTIVVGAKSVLP